MEPSKLQTWKDSFNLEMENLRISSDAFFVTRNIDTYYTLHVDEEYSNLKLTIKDEEELPKEIIKRIMDAFVRCKPE